VTETIQSSRPSAINEVRFSVIAHAAWAPGLETPADWLAWADRETVPQSGNEAIGGSSSDSSEPVLTAMPAMLRRRASAPGKMALNTAYAVAAGRTDIPVVFCSRHGECGRSAELLTDLARQLPLSPTAFSLSVHNATGGLFSIARHDQANSLALAAGHSTVEHAVIEACGLLADGAATVLLVASDGPLPEPFNQFADCDEQSFGWAWLLQAAQSAQSPQSPQTDTINISLRWSGCKDTDSMLEDEPAMAEPGGLQVMRFFLRGDIDLQRSADQRRWTWSRND
jgi:hypothetical protein